METIVALATPPGNSGVAVIRVSGDSSLEILKKITRDERDFEPRKMYLREIFFDNSIDKCLVVYFRAPFSYTGEDTVEIQSHGGFFLANKIIDECIRLGARLATAGEFSKRAFINGKMSIDQAEGIMDLIHAESDVQLKLGSNLMIGKLRSKIEKLQNILTDILADTEAKLDYPEYDYTETETNDTLAKLESVESQLDDLIADSKTGMIIKNGVKVALIGAPNVGKSSLLNALTNTDKAIVTNVAGTTRDVVEAEYIYKGIVFRVFDTAGIHESDDVVEKIGIDRARNTINDSDIVIRVSTKDSICDIPVDKPFIDVFNKCDLSCDMPTNYLCVSAKTGLNLDKLKEKIFTLTTSEHIDTNKLYLTNTRHIECVKRAKEHVHNALQLFTSTTMDIISGEIRSAWLALGEVSGNVSNETILDRIFSKFCLGK